MLAGAAGALSVLAAASLVKAAPAGAANGDPLVLGSTSNTETSSTLLNNSTANQDGLDVVASGAGFGLSGMATSAAGARSITVKSVSLRTSSLVLATVQNNAGVSVSYVVPNPSRSSVILHLDKPVPAGKTANVAWFVVN